MAPAAAQAEAQRIESERAGAAAQCAQLERELQGSRESASSAAAALQQVLSSTLSPAAPPLSPIHSRAHCQPAPAQSSVLSRFSLKSAHAARLVTAPSSA